MGASKVVMWRISEVRSAFAFLEAGGCEGDSAEELVELAEVLAVEVESLLEVLRDEALFAEVRR